MHICKKLDLKTLVFNKSNEIRNLRPYISEYLIKRNIIVEL